MKKSDFIFPVEGYCKTTNERVLTYIKCKTKKKLYSGDHSDPVGIAWNSEGWWSIYESSSKTAYSEKYFLAYLDYLADSNRLCLTTIDTTSICITDKPDYLETYKLCGAQVVSTQSWVVQETVEYRIKVECKLLNPLPVTNYNINKIKCQNSKKILKFF